jgi:hypothetical protein
MAEVNREINKTVVFDTPDKLMQKWEPVIECKGKAFDVIGESMPKIKSRHRHIVAMQLEQLEKLVLEASVSGDVEQFQPILIPMLRRVIPSLIGMEIFGVQPLATPSGLIFALRALYAGSAADPQKYTTTQVVILADATNFVVGGHIRNTGDVVTGTVVFKEGNKLLVKITSGSGLDRFAVADEVDNAASFSAAESTVSSQTANEALYKIIFSSWTGSVTTAAGEVLGTDMKELGVTIEKATATAKTRKMKSSYTREMAEDMQSCHGIDAVSLFTQVGSEEIILELNREFIDLADAKAVIGGVSTWNYSLADGRWEVEKYQNLAAKVSRTSREIAKANRRGQGNFMIVDTSTLTALEMSGRLDTTNVDPLASAFVGMFNGYIKTFVDIQQDETQIVMGYKGQSEVDAGVFYSPYVPLKITQGVDQDSDQPKIFFRMRYALTDNPYGAEHYFRKIEITNLPG